MSWHLTGFAHEPMCGGDVADVIGDDGEPKTCCLNIEDAKLIAAAGTARARAEEMGYDGRAAVEALPELIGALSSVNQLIAEAATTGFNCHDGDWAERLFFSQQATSDALTKSKGGRG